MELIKRKIQIKKRGFKLWQLKCIQNNMQDY